VQALPFRHAKHARDALALHPRGGLRPLAKRGAPAVSVAGDASNLETIPEGRFLRSRSVGASANEGRGQGQIGQQS
jgi:hypothetical protein